MKRYLYVSPLVGAFCLQCLPLFLQAQMRGGLPPSIEGQVTPSAPLENPVQPALSSPQVSERFLDILDFWVGFLPDPAYFPENKLPIWFTETAEIDRQIRQNFSQDVINASSGEYNSWRDKPRSRLALILLLDQFPRHIYRHESKEFIFDKMASTLVLEGLQKGDDRRLYPIEKAFFYLPLEHVENLDMQNLAVSLYQQLVMDSPKRIKPQMEAFLRYAVMHQQQIARFGRFPHRNAILGRESTVEEEVFLRQWGEPSF